MTATVRETCPCGATFHYDGDYAGQRVAAFRAEHQVCREQSATAAAARLAETTSLSIGETSAKIADLAGVSMADLTRPRRRRRHQPCSLGLELRTYIGALRGVVKAYEDAGRGDEAGDIDEFADELEQLWSGTPAATLVADWYGQPGVERRPLTRGAMAPPRKPPTPTDAIGGHVDVRLGPGETITIMTDPARVDDASDPNGTVVLHGRLIADGSYGGPHMKLDAAYPARYRRVV